MKKGTFLFYAIVIIAIVSIIAVVQFRDTELWQGCLESTDGESMVCVVIRAANSLIPFNIDIDPATPSPGEEIIINLGLTVESSQTPINSANLFLQRADGTETLQTYSFLHYFGFGTCEGFDEFGNPTYGGCSFIVSTAMTAPNEPGDYQLFARVQSGAQILANEIQPFSVGTGECPSDTCADWQVLNEIVNGVVQLRQCTEYGSAPLCNSNTDYEYRTICNAGYVPDGYNTNIAEGIHNCVPENGGGSSGGGSSGGGTDTVCIADLRNCLNEQTLTVCSNDGTVLQEIDCAPGETCLQGLCLGDGETPGGAGLCRAYEFGNNCEFSFSLLTTNDGLGDFWEDYMWYIIGTLLLLVVLVVVIIMKPNNGGM